MQVIPYFSKDFDDHVSCYWDACTNANDNLIQSMTHISLNWFSQTAKTQENISCVKKYGLLLSIAYKIPIRSKDIIILKPKVEYMNNSTFVWTDICFGSEEKKSFVAEYRIRIECHADFTKIGFASA